MSSQGLTPVDFPEITKSSFDVSSFQDISTQSIPSSTASVPSVGSIISPIPADRQPPTTADKHTPTELVKPTISQSEPGEALRHVPPVSFPNLLGPPPQLTGSSFDVSGIKSELAESVPNTLAQSRDIVGSVSAEMFRSDVSSNPGNALGKPDIQPNYSRDIGSNLAFTRLSDSAPTKPDIQPMSFPGMSGVAPPSASFNVTGIAPTVSGHSSGQFHRANIPQVDSSQAGLQKPNIPANIGNQTQSVPGIKSSNETKEIKETLSKFTQEAGQNSNHSTSSVFNTSSSVHAEIVKKENEKLRERFRGKKIREPKKPDLRGKDSKQPGQPKRDIGKAYAATKSIIGSVSPHAGGLMSLGENVRDIFRGFGQSSEKSQSTEKISKKEPDKLSLREHSKESVSATPQSLIKALEELRGEIGKLVKQNEAKQKNETKGDGGKDSSSLKSPKGKFQDPGKAYSGIKNIISSISPQAGSLMNLGETVKDIVDGLSPSKSVPSASPSQHHTPTKKEWGGGFNAKQREELAKANVPSASTSIPTIPSSHPWGSGDNAKPQSKADMAKDMFSGDGQSNTSDTSINLSEISASEKEYERVENLTSERDTDGIDFNVKDASNLEYKPSTKNISRAPVENDSSMMETMQNIILGIIGGGGS